MKNQPLGKRIWCLRIDHNDLELAKKRGIKLAPAIRNFVKTLLYSESNNKAAKQEKTQWKITKV
jgi:hypothetical protein